MALLVVQICRFVLYNLPFESAYVIFIGINQMFNVIKIYIFFILVLLITFTTWLRASPQQ